MTHNLWPSITEGIRNGFRFSGRMGRAPFWLWIGFLHVISGLAEHFWLLIFGYYTSWTPIPGRSTFGSWLGHSNFGKFIIDRVNEAWPEYLTVLHRPFVYNPSKGFLAPLTLLLFLLSLSAITRRIRDTGYSFRASLIICFWPILVPTLVVVLTLTFGAILPEMLAWNMAMATTFFFIANKYISLAVALWALYLLAAPSKPGPNPLEVTP